MAIFNKLQSLANKAKESSQAKNILTKDKRLEQSLSASVKPDKIWLDLMTTFGFDSKVSVMAFDPVAGLLAVGNSGPSIQLRIFGRGLSSTIPLTGINGIKYMQFKTGYPTLIIIDKKNIIYTMDLKKQTIQHILQAQGIVTSYDYCSNTDWLYLGFADGCIDVFDIHLGKMAPYGIPDLTKPGEGLQSSQQSSPSSPTENNNNNNNNNNNDNNNNNNSNNNVVVAILCHPTNLNWLLIGYDTMIFLWDIKEQVIHSTFKLDNSKKDVRLSSIVWSPQGDRFMAGYDDGYIYMWSMHNEQRPILSRQVFPSMDKSQPCEPVYKLAWYLNSQLQKTYLIVAGGSFFADIQGLHVLEFDYNPNDTNLNNNSINRDARKQSIIPCHTDLADFILLWNDPYAASDPLGIILLGTDGSPRAYGLDHGYPTLILPPSLALLNPFVSNSCFIPMLNEQLFRNLTTYTNIDRQLKHLPLRGGMAGSQHVYKYPSNDILLTIHIGEMIQFWDASYASLRPLSQLTIKCHDDIQDSSRFICCIDINSVSGTVCIGLDDGSIIVYELINKLQDIKKKEDEERERELKNINDQQYNAKFHEANTKFINQCDDTINELEQMLSDMQTPTDLDDEIQQQHNNTQDKNNDESNNNKSSGTDNNNICYMDDPKKEMAKSDGTITKNESVQENNSSTNPFLNNQPNNNNNDHVVINTNDNNDNNDNSSNNNSNDNNNDNNNNNNNNNNSQNNNTINTVNNNNDDNNNVNVTLPEINKIIKQEQPDDRFTILKRTDKLFGYVADLKIKLDGTIQTIASAGLDIIACATVTGYIYIINTTLQKIIYSTHVKDLIQQESSASKNIESHGESSSEKIELAFIKFINTYPYKNSSYISTQLFIGLSNGNIYQNDIGSRNNKWDEVQFYRSSKCSKSIQDINIIDLNGNQQNADEFISKDHSTSHILPTIHINNESNIKSTESLSSTTQPKNDRVVDLPKDNQSDQFLSNNNNNNSGVSFLRRKSLKKISTKSSKAPNESTIDNEQHEAWEELSRTSTVKSNASSTSSMTTVGKDSVDDYLVQDQPHLIIITYLDSVHVILAGVAIKIYEFRLNDLENGNQNGSIINTKLNHIDNLLCLSLLLGSGQLLVLSLPHLQPIAKTPLPNNIHKLKESVLTQDGRILFWTGQYEMQEWIYLHSETSLSYGNSVQLFDPEKVMPPHPSSIQQQKNKRGLLGAVAGVFKKEPLSLMELDQIMGRKPQHITSAENTTKTVPESSSTGVKQSGVFKELSDKMNERGEKLDEMQQKFTEMSDTSNDFLRAVREYNERQAQKKWWEF
ncbi:unnamed protein product [Cunninghamella blakesleeana]